MIDLSNTCMLSTAQAKICGKKKNKKKHPYIEKNPLNVAYLFYTDLHCNFIRILKLYLNNTILIILLLMGYLKTL